MTMPPDAPNVSRPAEQPFGDAVAGAHWRQVRQTLDRLEPAHPDLLVTFAVVERGTDPAELEAWYAAQLGEAWHEVPIGPSPPGWGFAFANGDRLFAVVGHDSATGQQPLAILSNLQPGD